MFKIFKAAVLITLALFSNLLFADDFSKNKKVQEFIANMQQKHKFDSSELSKIFSNYQPSDDILKLIAKPYEDLKWPAYRKLFIDDKRINAGVEFWKQHREVLQRVSEKYQVVPEIILAILGVETYYGNNKGKYPVIQALATLAFHYPPRAKFFTQELEKFLLLARKHNLDMHKITGSYAGAIGIPQFISSSYLKYAVGYADPNKADLINSSADAIASIANYLHVHGWQYNEDIAFNIKYNANLSHLFDKNNDPRPKYSTKYIKTLGINMASNYPENASCLNIGDQHWLGFQNFYAITRYNHSNNYAMVVTQLAQAIKANYAKNTQ